MLLLAIALVARSIGSALILYRLGKRTPRLTPLVFFPRRILVVRVDLIGDLILSLTLVHALKRTYPDAEIDLLAVPSSAQVVAQHPDLAGVITYDPNLWRRPKALVTPKNWRNLYALRRRLHERDYDLAVSVFGPWAAALTLLSGAKRRLGFGKESYPGFMTDSVAGAHWSDGAGLHEVDYCLQLAQAAGCSLTSADRVPQLPIGSQAEQDGERLLRSAGVDFTRRLIACHVSSNNGYSKRWPIPYWASLIDTLLTDDRVTVLFTGAPNDLPLIEAIIKRMRRVGHTQQTTNLVNLAGKTSLVGLAAVLQRADLLVTGDSGPMHIAAAAGTPLIAIHGPTDPAMSGPVSPTATVLRSDIWCSPCYTAKAGPADCRFFTTQCMKNLTPHQVLYVVYKKLGLQRGFEEEILAQADGETPPSPHISAR